MRHILICSTQKTQNIDGISTNIDVICTNIDGISTNIDDILSFLRTLTEFAVHIDKVCDALPKRLCCTVYKKHMKRLWLSKICRIFATNR